jgi:hypothetical protein
MLPLLALAVAGPGGHGDPAQGPDVPVAGYGLYRYAPPGWHWEPSPVSGPVAEVSTGPDGECTVSFAVPEAQLPGLMPDRARFGVASGALANGPTVWLSPAQDFIRLDDPSPLGGPIFGQASLLRGRVRRGGGVLRAEVTFGSAPALESAWDLMGLIDADGDPNNGYHGAEWLLQNVPLGAGPPPGLGIVWFEARPGILLQGHTATVTAWVENNGPDAIERVAVRLVLPQGLVALPPDTNAPCRLRHGEAHRFAWTVQAARTGLFALRLRATGVGRTLQRTRWVTVVGRRDPRREFESQDGDWLQYPERPTLQQDNAAPLSRLEPLPSRALKHNLFGITAHLPRRVDDEDPFCAAKAVDGDPATCWASRWWRTAVPFEPEWLQVDLGRALTITEARVLPAWHDGGLPAAFALEVSADGSRWETIAEDTDYRPETHPDGSALRSGDLSWQCFPFPARRARFLRLVATRLNQGATSFFCAPSDPFQLRVAEFVAADEAGAVRRPVRASASTTHHAWYNSPQTVTRTWPLLPASGVKLNRIGQWGDRTDWAAVEQTRGVYRIPPEVDRAITRSRRAGIETLLTLAYGNNLYQQVEHAPGFGPTWHRGHPFLQCAPTTPEAVEGFARYCAFMARHFRGRVRYFEIWNEENGWFFDDWATGSSVAQVVAYGRVLRAAAMAIKDSNPDAVVVFGGTAGSTLDYPRVALDEGAGPWVDVFAFHPYGHPTPEAAPDAFYTRVGDNMAWRPRPEGITGYEQEIAALRQLLHGYNPRMQVWADEMNWLAPGEPPRSDLGDQSELTQAKHLARFYALNAWLGCAAVWWSLYNANGIQEWAVVRSADLTPRPAWHAAQYASTVLDDVHAAGDLRPEITGHAPPGLIAKVFRSGRGQVLVGLWRTSFGSDTCRPEPVTVRVPGLRADSGELLDLLYGSRQRAQLERDAGGLTLRGVLVGDWPLIARLR